MRQRNASRSSQTCPKGQSSLLPFLAAERWKMRADSAISTRASKSACLPSQEHYLTFQMGASIPTGHADLGLGTNHFTVEPMLLFNQKVSDRVTLAGQFGDSHPVGGSSNLGTGSEKQGGGFAGDVLIYGLGASYDFPMGPESRITPVLEFVGWSVLGGLDTNSSTKVNPSQSASGTNIVNVKFGIRSALSAHHSIYIGLGHSITNDHWYKELVRLEYRYAF